MYALVQPTSHFITYSSSAYEDCEDCRCLCHLWVWVLFLLCVVSTVPCVWVWVPCRVCECEYRATCRCEYCALGSTGLPLTYGMDACLVCGGDNSTCTDCRGVIHGGWLVDKCGACSDPSDGNWGEGQTRAADPIHRLIIIIITCIVQLA